MLDESDIPLTPTAQADVREPISSSCTGNPFNSDGALARAAPPRRGRRSSCSPTGRARASLFAERYQPTNPVTNPASSVTSSGATLNGLMNPEGSAIRVHFQYGTTTAYGSTTAAADPRCGNRRDAVQHRGQRLGPGHDVPFPSGSRDRLRDVPWGRSDVHDVMSEPGSLRAG